MTGFEQTVPELVARTMPAVIGALLGATAGFVSSHYLQNRVGVRLQRIRALREAFYDYLELVGDYWSGSNDPSTRARQESRLLVQQRVILLEYQLLARESRRMRRSLNSTRYSRVSLWREATGGCFQQKKWEPDPTRQTRAATAVSKIVRSFS